MKNQILSALQWRYAVKIFDATKKISDDDLTTILQAGRLAPSPYGVEPWKFIVITQPTLRTTLRMASFDQPKVTDASHIMVIARRMDVREHIVAELLARTAEAHHKELGELEGLQKMVEGFIARQTDDQLDCWVRSQSYIPLGMMIEAAALLGIDACPMEGFNAKEVNEILRLPEKHLAATTMFALGYRGDDPMAQMPKVRRAFDDVVEFIR